MLRNKDVIKTNPNLTENSNLLKESVKFDFFQIFMKIFSGFKFFDR